MSQNSSRNAALGIKFVLEALLFFFLFVPFSSDDVLCRHEQRVDILEAVELGLVDALDGAPETNKIKRLATLVSTINLTRCPA